jgi:hypothetical protein
MESTIYSNSANDLDEFKRLRKRILNRADHLVALMMLPLASLWTRFGADLAVFGRTDSHDSRVNCAADAVLLLKIDLRDLKFSKDDLSFDVSL